MKNKILKIFLIISIIILLLILIYFLINCCNFFKNGIDSNTNWFSWFDNSEIELVYGREAISVYLSEIEFKLYVYSMFGIPAIILIPIFSSVLLRTIKKYTKTKNIVIMLSICVIVHILTWLFIDFMYYEFVIIEIMPFIESLLLSYIIAKKCYIEKSNNTNNVVNN